jgi:hypothetical protein
MAGASTAIRARSARRVKDGDVALKLRVSHLVESVDFEPRELPPAATLIVRRFTDPMPRCLQSDASAFLPAPAWEQAARSGLSGFARRAVRPARETVPPDAEAVLFSDEAELLACFSRDLVRGDATSQWWWRTYLRSSSSAVSFNLFESWRREVRYVPSALDHLSSRGEAEWILNAFSPAQALKLLEEVASTFEIGQLCVFPQPQFSGSLPSSPGDRSKDPTTDGKGIGASTKFDAHAPVAAPWLGLLAANLVPVRLSRERMALLGVSLVVSRAPTIARSRSFREAFSLWLRPASSGAHLPMERGHTEDPNAQGSGSELSAAEFRPRPSTNRIESTPDSPEREETSSSGAHGSGAFSPETSPKITKDADARFADPMDAHVAVDSGRKDSRVEMHAGEVAFPTPGPRRHLNATIEEIARIDEPPEAMPVAGVDELSGIKRQSSDHAERMPDVLRAIDAGEGVLTEFGGILFLVNLLKALRLPASLECACDCEFGLGSWELIELIARCLLGSEQSRLSNDPIWTLLAILDGRAPERKAGDGFVPANCYRIPGEWIPDSDTFDSTSDYSIRIRGLQLECWHRLGFPCAVRRFNEPPSQTQIEREMQAYPRASCSILRRYPQTWSKGRLLGFAPERPLRRFLSFLLPFVRWRLAAAMGLQSAKPRVRGDALLLRTGKIWMTSTHVDLVMELGQATGPVRLAGLDADPGWVPELGRVVKFHFQ